MAFNSCPGYQLNKRWKNDKIEVLEGKTFYAINTKTCGTQKKMDDKNLVKNWKNILTLANVPAYIYMYKTDKFYSSRQLSTGLMAIVTFENGYIWFLDL